MYYRKGKSYFDGGLKGSLLNDGPLALIDHTSYRGTFSYFAIKKILFSRFVAPIGRKFESVFILFTCCHYSLFHVNC